MLTVLVSIVVTLFVAIQDPIVQRFAVRFVGGYLSEKTGAEIKVGKLSVTPDFRVVVDNVSVKDLNDNDLAKIGTLMARIHITELLEGKIHLSGVLLRDADANLIKYEGSDQFNFQFLADFFSSDKEKDPNKKPMPLVIDRISLKNVNFQYWDQNKADSTKTGQNLMDYAHLDLDDINLSARHFALVGDSVYVVVEKLSAKEQCGLDLKHFQSDVMVCQKGIFLKDMQMETNNSLFHMDLDMKYDSYAAFNDFVNAVDFDATIHPTDVMLSDIGYFSSVMYEMPNRIRFEGKFSGPIEHFSVKDMVARFGKTTTIKGDLSMHPLNFNDGQHALNIKNMHFSYEDLTNFHIPGKTGTIPLPEQLSSLESGDVKLNFKGSYNNFHSNVDFRSDVANLKANVTRNKQGLHTNVFSGDIDAQRIDAGIFAKTKLIGKLDVNADFSVKFNENGHPELDLNGKILDAELLGNHIDEIVMNGEMKGNRFNGKLDVDDDELYLDFNGLIDFTDSKHPTSNFEAVIRNADLHSLNIMKEDSVSVVSTRIYANMVGFNIDDLEGTLHLDSTVYRDSRGEYVMKSFDARIVNDNLMQRRINLTNDFFDFEMGGKVNFASLMMSLNEYGDNFVHFPIWEENLEKFEKYKEKHDVEQDFFAKLSLKDTRTLSRLFMPSIQIAENTSVNATFTSRSRQFNLTARSKEVRIGDLVINNIELKNNNLRNSAFGSLSVDEIVWTNMTKTDTMALGLDNIKMYARMANDTIATRISWDDVSPADHNKALIEATFHPHESGGIINVGKADIVVNDSLWQMSSDNYINLDNGRVELSNILLSHNRQSLRANGYVPTGEQDTLSVQLNRFDISMLDFLLMSSGLDLDGYITGDASLANLKGNPMVLADLGVEDLWLNNERVGDAVIKSIWDNDNQAVNVDVGIINNDTRSLSMLGSYYTKRKENNLDFDLKLDSLQLAVISPFLAGQISRIQGFGTGNASIKGSLKQPQIEGSVKIDGGGCKVAYLNTFYTFSPTIKLDSKTIELKDMVLTDTLGNKARVEGKIYHENLKNFMLDLMMFPRNFLVMATTIKDNDTFYGDVIANGVATVKGPVKDIALDVKARTQKGTQLTLPLNRVSTVRDNDFIVFVNNDEEEEAEEVEDVMERTKKKSNFSIAIDANVTDDASMKIFLPSDIGIIDATGHGDLKMVTSSSDPFSLIGDYTINSGSFQLNLKNVLYKDFVLKPGGTITWTGSPTDGRINATGAYSVKTSLASLGAEVDSTASGGSKVNAECLIHLDGALLNPTISFGLNLPNASDDVRQTVYSLIDTTNQAIMSTQALSLLLLGSFSYAGSSNANTVGLGDLLSNFMSSAFKLELTKDMDLGVKYHLGSGYSNYDEVQMVLRMELFENRLTIETNFGVISDNNTNAEQATNLVGEFDINYKLSKDGRLKAHFYNHSNYNANYSSFAFDKLAPYTQGLGLSYSRSFNTLRDLFKPKQSTATGRSLMNRRPQTVTPQP